MSTGRHLLGALLLEMGFIDKEQLKAALEENRRTGKRIGRVLIERGVITEDRLVHALSRQLGLDVCDPVMTPVHEAVLAMVPSDVAFRFRVLPVARQREGNVETIYVATADPMDRDAMTAVSQAMPSGTEVRWMLAGETEMDLALARHYGSAPSSTPSEAPKVIQGTPVSAPPPPAASEDIFTALEQAVERSGDLPASPVESPELPTLGAPEVDGSASPSADLSHLSGDLSDEIHVGEPVEVPSTPPLLTPSFVETNPSADLALPPAESSVDTVVDPASLEPFEPIPLENPVERDVNEPIIDLGAPKSPSALMPSEDQANVSSQSWGDLLGTEEDESIIAPAVPELLESESSAPSDVFKHLEGAMDDLPEATASAVAPMPNLASPSKVPSDSELNAQSDDGPTLEGQRPADIDVNPPLSPAGESSQIGVPQDVPIGVVEPIELEDEVSLDEEEPIPLEDEVSTQGEVAMLEVEPQAVPDTLAFEPPSVPPESASFESQLPLPPVFDGASLPAEPNPSTFELGTDVPEQAAPFESSSVSPETLAHSGPPVAFDGEGFEPPPDEDMPTFEVGMEDSPVTEDRGDFEVMPLAFDPMEMAPSSAAPTLKPAEDVLHSLAVEPAPESIDIMPAYEVPQEAYQAPSEATEPMVHEQETMRPEPNVGQPPSLPSIGTLREAMEAFSTGHPSHEQSQLALRTMAALLLEAGWVEEEPLRRVLQRWSQILGS